VAKTQNVEFRNGFQIPILYEDRAGLAIDRPAGWMVIPQSWDKTNRTLQLAFQSSIHGGDFWARSRNLKYLRFVHRLDAETTGVLLLAKNPGALQTFTELFASRKMEKIYLAVIRGIPRLKKWRCDLAVAPDAMAIGKMKIHVLNGKPALTCFQVLETAPNVALVEARPITGRTHQIRLHLAAAGYPVLGDRLYGSTSQDRSDVAPGLALRAVSLSYRDPFRKHQICIRAPFGEFKKRFGFDPEPKA